MKRIMINGRYRSHIQTGMQNYAAELTARMQGRVETISPARSLKGAQGHLWEQLFLPMKARRSLLWSPNNTGPLAARHQVCTFHDLFPIEHPDWYSADFARLYAWLLPMLVKRVAHMIAVSHYTKQSLMKRLGVPADKITVIHNGVGDQYRRRSPEEISAARARLGIDFERYVVTVGSAGRRKNLSKLLEAWPKISKSVPDLGLVVAGHKCKVRSLSQTDFSDIPERTYFTDYVPQELLPALYSGATSIIHPTLGEGFGLPPLEAMACGTPAIVSMNTALPEVVGDAAIGIDPHDVDSIADAVIRMVSSSELQQEHRRRGKRRAAMFSWKQCAEQTWKVLEAFA